MDKKTKQFIEKAKNVHGDGRYEYSNVVYKNVDTKVEIKCNVCETKFLMTPYSHLNKSAGCVTCGNNARRKTKESFIKESESIHGKGRYSYNKVIYTNAATEVTLFCNNCNKYFNQTPQNHITAKCGCTKCSNKLKTKDSDLFLDEMKNKYPNYNFDKTKYVNARTKLTYFCNICNSEKEQLPGPLRRNGCPDCSRKSGTFKQTYTLSQFIEKAKNVHGNDTYNYDAVKYTYNYDAVKYTNISTKIKIKCNGCGNVLLQTPSTHLSGKGCYDCKVLKPMPIEEFIERSEKVHGKGKYNYTLVHEKYKNNRSLVDIKCNVCGNISTKSVNSHLTGHGCKYCNNSRGEETIAKVLKENNIQFEREKKIDGCKHKRLLKFDFYLNDFNACIEFDGRQHFEVVEYFGEQTLLENQIRDGIKNKFCLNNNIPLLRIKYDVKDIETLVLDFINQFK